MVFNGRGRTRKTHRLNRKEDDSSTCSGCGASEDNLWTDPLTGECVCTICGLVQDCRLISPEVYAADLTSSEEVEEGGWILSSMLEKNWRS